MKSIVPPFDLKHWRSHRLGLEVRKVRTFRSRLIGFDSLKKKKTATFAYGDGCRCFEKFEKKYIFKNK